MRNHVQFCIAILIVAMTAAGVEAASVTVAKSGGDFTTVQEGLNAAGAGGTVTILDSETYIEDVTIETAMAGITLQAADGQSPTIQNANTRLHANYAALGILVADRFGCSVWGPCTIEGINFVNPDGATNTSSAFGDLTACAMAIHSPGVVVRNCTMAGPGTGFSGGDWSTVLVISWGPEPQASAVFEGCEISGGEYGLVNETFGLYITDPAPWTSALVEATTCTFHDNTINNVVSDAGVTTLTACISEFAGDNGISVGGGTTYLVGCDFLQNGQSGIELDFNDSFSLPGDWPVCYATDCLLANNQGDSRDISIQIANGSLTIDHSIVTSPANRAGIYMDDNDAAAPCQLVMDYCDVYTPGLDCFWFDQDVNEHPIEIAITNSILVGQTILHIQQTPVAHPVTISNSDLIATGVPTAGVTETNNVSIDPNYRAPALNQRSGFKYWEETLNVGVGGTYIGSQGWIEPTPELGAARWYLYR
jgi:hypothetical protein